MGGRVAITGAGVVSAAGGDVPSALDTLRSGRRPALSPCPFHGFQERPVFIAPFQADGADRTFALALAAAREALAGAGLAHPPDGFRLGVCLGTTVACQLNDIGFYRAYRETGHPPLDAAERFAAGSLAERIAHGVGAAGPCMTVVNACASGTDAVGVALAWLRAGLCDAVLAGGADEMSEIPASGFFALGLCSPEPCRPFDNDRQGLNLGEGAGCLVLEREASAQGRGLLPEVFAAGFGASADGHHLTAPHPDGAGLERAIRAALADAGIVPADIDFINAHGTATRENDRIEGQTLARVFGPSVRAVSTKGFTGHTLGAAGGVEAVFTALALREGWLPGCAGFATRDGTIPFAPPTEVTPVRGRFALSTSLAFGGNNSALVLARGEGGAA